MRPDAYLKEHKRLKIGGHQSIFVRQGGLVSLRLQSLTNVNTEDNRKVVSEETVIWTFYRRLNCKTLLRILKSYEIYKPMDTTDTRSNNRGSSAHMSYTSKHM